MNELIGHKVVVYSTTAGNERQDIGVLQSAEGTWICIKKGEEQMYFSVYNIRLIKPFES